MKKNKLRKSLSCMLALIMAAVSVPAYAESAQPDTEPAAYTQPDEETPAADEPGDSTPKGATHTEGYYTIDDEGSLTGYSGNETVVVVPSTVAGITVKDIGKAFEYNKTITEITFPDTLESINKTDDYWGGFKTCNSLEKVNFGKGIKYIGAYSFYGSSALTSLTFPDSLENIGKNAFYECTSLATINFGNGIKSIGDYAFYRCSKLTKVDIPDSVTEIGNYCFSYFSNCGVLNIGSNVKTIGEGAFRNMPIVRVTVPDSVTTIGIEAFSSCNKLVKATLSNNLTSIPERLFQNCDQLTSIIIPDSVTSIGDYAFSGCNSMKNVTWGKNISTVGYCAFSGCKVLESITFTNALTSIGGYAFSSCTAITSVEIPDSVTELGRDAFSSCTNLASVKIGKGIKILNVDTFYSCTSLTEIDIPANIEEIGAGSFNSSTSLEKVTLHEGLRVIGSNAFYGTALKSVVIPDSVYKLDSDPFNSCAKLTTIYIGSGMTALTSTFSSCSELSYIGLDKDLESIGDDVFKFCHKISDIYYTGTKARWEEFCELNPDAYLISIEDQYVVHCTDGDIVGANAAEKIVEKITVTAPTKTEYVVGDKLDVTGGYVNVYYTTKPTESVPLTLDMCSYNFSSAGSKSVTVTYGGKTTYFSVKVVKNTDDVKTLQISKNPNKLTYSLNEKLNLTGGELKVTYESGKTETVSMTDPRVTTSTFNSSTAGSKTVYIYFLGKSVSLSVNVVSGTVTTSGITINGIEYPTLADALKSIKTYGNHEILVSSTITEKSSLALPKIVTNVTIRTTNGAVIYMASPSIAANSCNLTLDASIESSKSNARTLTIKAGADKTVTINRLDTSLPLTLSGAKTSDFILNTNSALNVLSAATVNVEIASGTTVVLNAGKLTPTALSGAGKVIAYGASTLNIADAVNADITLNQYKKVSGKNTIILLPKLIVGTIKNMSLTVNNTSGSLADINGTTVFLLAKANEVANLEKLITITNKANGKKLSAVQYKKEVRAEYIDALTISDGINSKNYSSLDKAFGMMTNTSGNYTITLNESISASKITLPKKVASLTINGGGNTLKFVGMTSFAPKYAFSLENITIISEDNKGNAAAFTINSSTGNTTVDGLIFSGKSLTIKGGSGNDLTLGKCSRINTLSGFKTIAINAAVEIEKTLTATNLTLGSTANLTIGTGATATVKTSLTGVNGAKITLADAYKSFTLNGAINGDKIKLVSEKSLEDKIIFKTKLDLSGKFDVSGIAPTNAGTLKYDLLTNGGNAYLKAFAIDVNGTKYAFWNDAIAAITDKDTDYTITLLADVNIGAAFKLPAKGKFKSFTLNGNGHKLTFVGTSVSLTGNTTFRNITISSVSKKTGEAVAWKLTVGKFDLTKENIDLVSCTLK